MGRKKLLFGAGKARREETVAKKVRQPHLDRKCMDCGGCGEVCHDCGRPADECDCEEGVADHVECRACGGMGTTEAPEDAR